MARLLPMSVGLLLSLASCLAALAVVTAVWVRAIETAHPPIGKLVPVTGGRLHALDLSPEDGSGQEPPVILLHGATANLHDMRIALAERLATTRRTILV